MSSIDDAIRDALDEEDEAFLAQFDKEPSIFAQAIGTLRGRMWFWNAYAMVLTFILFGVAVYCGWKFFTTEDVRTMLMWGLGTSLAALAVAMLKLWFWMQMSANTVLREMKRLELQVARMSSRGSV